MRSNALSGGAYSLSIFQVPVKLFGLITTGYKDKKVASLNLL